MKIFKKTYLLAVWLMVVGEGHEALGMRKPIAVAYTINEQSMNQMLHSMSSVVLNDGVFNRGRPVHFFVLACGLSGELAAQLAIYPLVIALRTNPAIQINISWFDMKQVSAFPDDRRGRMSYVKAFLDLYIPDAYPRVVYLDSDTHVCDIGALWGIDLKGHKFAAICGDPLIRRKGSEPPCLLEKPFPISMSELSASTIDDGVVLFNMTEMRNGGFCALRGKCKSLIEDLKKDEALKNLGCTFLDLCGLSSEDLLQIPELTPESFAQLYFNRQPGQNQKIDDFVQNLPYGISEEAFLLGVISAFTISDGPFSREKAAAYERVKAEMVLTEEDLHNIDLAPNKLFCLEGILSRIGIEIGEAVLLPFGCNAIVNSLLLTDYGNSSTHKIRRYLYEYFERMINGSLSIYIFESEKARTGTYYTLFSKKGIGPELAQSIYSLPELWINILMRRGNTGGGIDLTRDILKRTNPDLLPLADAAFEIALSSNFNAIKLKTWTTDVNKIVPMLRHPALKNFTTALFGKYPTTILEDASLTQTVNEAHRKVDLMRPYFFGPKMVLHDEGSPKLFANRLLDDPEYAHLLKKPDIKEMWDSWNLQESILKLVSQEYRPLFRTFGVFASSEYESLPPDMAWLHRIRILVMENSI